MCLNTFWYSGGTFPNTDLAEKPYFSSVELKAGKHFLGYVLLISFFRFVLSYIWCCGIKIFNNSILFQLYKFLHAQYYLHSIL